MVIISHGQQRTLRRNRRRGNNAETNGWMIQNGTCYVTYTGADGLRNSTGSSQNGWILSNETDWGNGGNQEEVLTGIPLPKCDPREPRYIGSYVTTVCRTV